MLSEKITAMNPLNIMPEDFYFDTLRKDFIEVLSKVKFDKILLSTVEEVMNKADGASVNRRYNSLEEYLQPLAIALLSSSTYQKSDDFIRADEEEKAIVRKLAKDVQDLLTIIKCTKEPEKTEEKFNRERLNYDSVKKENITLEPNEVNKKERIPNVNNN